METVLFSRNHNFIQNQMKVKNKVIPVHAMKHVGGAEVQLHSFVTSALDKGEWSNSRPDRFTPEKELRYPLNTRLGGPRSRSGRYGEHKNVCPYRDSNAESHRSQRGATPTTLPPALRIQLNGQYMLTVSTEHTSHRRHFQPQQALVSYLTNSVRSLASSRNTKRQILHKAFISIPLVMR